MDRIDEIRARLKECGEPLPNTWTVPVYDQQEFHSQIADDLRFLLLELAEHKQAAGVVGRRYRDLLAENERLEAELDAARGWARLWKRAAKNHRAWDTYNFERARELRHEVERQHDVIGRLVWALNYVLEWVKIAPLYARVCTVVIDELGLTWADAIEKGAENGHN